MTETKFQYVFASGIGGGFLPDVVIELGELTPLEAAEYLRDEIGDYVDDVAHADDHCSEEIECYGCSALAEIGAVIADGDYYNGVTIYINEWEYMQVYPHFAEDDTVVRGYN